MNGVLCLKLHENKEDFFETIEVVSQHYNLSTSIIEKDYWVTFLLYNLHHSAYKDEIAFKGGTSLSKGYKLIDRFSEDVDLTVIKKNYRLDSENEALITKVHKEIIKQPFG